MFWELWKMKKEEGALICTDEEYSYYSLSIAGRRLLYRRRRLRPDGRKCFMFTNQLAMLLEFEEGLVEMMHYVPELQYWRRFVSVNRLIKVLEKHDYF